MENQPTFVRALVNVLFIIFVYGLFILPWTIWLGAMNRIGAKSDENFMDKVKSTEFMVFYYFKLLFDAIIFLAYIIGPIVAIISAFSDYGGGFSAFLLGIIGAYLSPLWLSLIKEVITLALVQVLKIEEIADNTKS